jgi:hypothetical protein
LLALSDFVHRIGFGMTLGSFEFCFSVLFSACLSERWRFFLVGHGQTCRDYLAGRHYEPCLSVLVVGNAGLFGADSTQKVVVSSFSLMSIHICSVMMT